MGFLVWHKARLGHFYTITEWNSLPTIQTIIQLKLRWLTAVFPYSADTNVYYIQSRNQCSLTMEYTYIYIFFLSWPILFFFGSNNVLFRTWLSLVDTQIVRNLISFSLSCRYNVQIDKYIRVFCVCVRVCVCKCELLHRL